MNDTWDRAAFAKKFEAEKKATGGDEKIFACCKTKLCRSSYAADEIAKNDDSMKFKMLKAAGFDLWVDQLEAATEHAQAMYKSLADDPASINMLAWILLWNDAQGRIEKDR